MTNYGSIWEKADNNWTPIDFKDCHILNILLVSSWVALISFSLFAVFTLLTGSDVAALFMLAAAFCWLACSIAYIRIRRARRNRFKVML